MSKYEVLYIDEQQDSREKYADELTDVNLEVKTVHPFASMEEMVSYILKEKIDAIVVDYGLRRNDSTITYDGGQLINKFNEIMEDFPAFVLTQDIEQDDGIDEHVLSTKIILKDVLSEKPDSIRRILVKYIKKYKNENLDLSKELMELATKRKGQGDKLTDMDLERLNYLDEKIERRLNGGRMFPALLKSSDNLQHLNNVLDQAEKYLSDNIKKK